MSPHQGSSIIEDFEDSQDKLDLAGSLAFEDLDVVQQGSDTAIYFEETQIATLLEFETNHLSVADFD